MMASQGLSKRNSHKTMFGVGLYVFIYVNCVQISSNLDISATLILLMCLKVNLHHPSQLLDHPLNYCVFDYIHNITTE